MIGFGIIMIIIELFGLFGKTPLLAIIGKYNLQFFIN